MPILESLKIRYKSQPAVTTRQGHQKRRMRKIGCKKHFCSKVIFSSQGKTSQAHLGAKRNSPVATGEYGVKQVLSHLPTHWTDLEYVGFFLVSVGCYSAQVDMAQHGLPSESLRAELYIQAQLQDCYR